ncbi:hypothetical protein KCG44_12855 [Pacificimonas sp. WHA3]|uniref:Uncharacterized protein n=1 Tax=Pacificimonas pallii TaxID=2827236 RepID=A0ABS6SGY1_9SPHN|nr:hypothetical protein [Pacificimonas pallii]MBV7257675.1 hypothetical protein [Pacificimonas pallii]
MTGRLDVPAILQAAVMTWWRDFAPIAILGLGLVVGPEVIMQMLGATESGASSTSTLATTIRALTRLMFVSAVMAATLASAARLDTRTYILAGLKRIQPPLVTGLLIAAMAVVMLIFGQLLALFVVPAAAILALPAILALMTFWLVAMPVAAALGVAPIAALRQSWRLVLPSQFKVFCVLLTAILALVPVLLLLKVVVLSDSANLEEVRAALASLGPATTGFWVIQLTAICAFGLLAVVPATLYRALAEHTPARTF